MSNQECKVIPQIVNVNSEDPAFFPCCIKTSKWGGSYNNINDPYAKFCVSDIAKNLNVGVFNLMSRTNETVHIELHEEVKLAKITSAEDENKYKKKCNFWTLYVVLFSITFRAKIGIGTYFFTTNTWIVMKKMLLNMVLLIKQQFKELINGKFQTN